MKPELKNDLLYTRLSVCHEGAIIEIDNILIDTGSSSTVISVDILSETGIKPEPTDILQTIRGVGGTEVVFNRVVEFIQVDDFKIKNFEVEVAGMDYGFDINGILGMNFLIPAGATLNLKEIEVHFTQKN
ncbi:MAG: hypothetical protein GY754_31775 [bacterium]|nr:hypothetical protein [bacterium]